MLKVPRGIFYTRDTIDPSKGNNRRAQTRNNGSSTSNKKLNSCHSFQARQVAVKFAAWRELISDRV